MDKITLPGGVALSRLGMGTAGLAEKSHTRASEISALQAGIELGMSLIDTAEAYADGEAERLVCKAIAGRRDRAFLVSKVCGYNATRLGIAQACEASLRRLGTDRIDLYLLHWRGEHSLEAAVEEMTGLVRRGLICHWGVSNFDVPDMEDLATCGGSEVATNQVLYNLERRGPELRLLPWLARKGIPMMAYSPIEQGSVLKHASVAAIATKHAASPAQVALAWIARQGIVAIPKASTVEHARDNAGAMHLALDTSDIAHLEAAFPRPERIVSLLPD
jgi:diketogulonate reductase-like aldo/keto reductase